MYLKVHPTHTFNGRIIPPSSKSQSVRGMMFALLAKGTSTLYHPLASDDMEDAIRVCRALGAQVQVQADQLMLHSAGLPLASDASSLYTGNSGITTRFILPILGLRSLSDRPIRLDCGDQMRARPIHALIQALRSLGMTIHYESHPNQLPVSISGSLQGGTAEVEGITSQYLSALLIALPCAEKDSVMVVRHLHERPYVQMTLDWLTKHQINYTHEQKGSQDYFYITGKQRYAPFQTEIAGDFSSASYLIAAAVMMPGVVELQGLTMQDPQGDKQLVTILQAMGADIAIQPSGLCIRGGKPLKGISVDANAIPDLLPTLAVIGTYAEGQLDIRNVPQARLKETDRIHSMSEGLQRLGAKVEEFSDGLTVYQSQLKGGSLKGYEDHRTVMALAVAGMLAKEAIVIDTAEAIHKTFPNFVETMNTLGANMEQLDCPLS